MAANKRYIIKVGDTVRIDPKKLAKFNKVAIDGTHIHSYLEDLYTIPAMHSSINGVFLVDSMYYYSIPVVKLSSGFLYPVCICTKVMNPTK
jgi:hypothetical protein